MEFDISILRKAGIDTIEGIKYTGGKEEYISALWRYGRAYDKDIEKIKKALEEKNCEDYMQVVHPLKSNSRMIGASETADMFEKLEIAARDGDSAAIASDTEPALTMYKQIVELLKPLSAQENVKATGEISAEEAKQTADKLLEALDDFDEELSEKLLNKLSGYPFRITQRNRLNTAVGKLRDFDYDGSAEIIREIYKDII